MALGELKAYRAMLGTRMKDRFLQTEGLDTRLDEPDPEVDYMPRDLGPIETRQ